LPAGGDAYDAAVRETSDLLDVGDLVGALLAAGGAAVAIHEAALARGSATT
jgi:hypothetical protein